MIEMSLLSLITVAFGHHRFVGLRLAARTDEVERVWGDNKPAMTLIPVPALRLRAMLVEIDVIAVVPA